jgi:hypothetical protein
MNSFLFEISLPELRSHFWKKKNKARKHIKRFMQIPYEKLLNPRICETLGLETWSIT